MKINKTNEFDAIRMTRQSDVKSTDKDKAVSSERKSIVGEDKLQFSNRAAEVGTLVDQVKDLPDVRHEKIDALRERIAAGEYNPSSEEIAEAIFKDEG
jgi:negative regulator of flagellin synthesis FlgM